MTPKDAFHKLLGDVRIERADHELVKRCFLAWFLSYDSKLSDEVCKLHR